MDGNRMADNGSILVTGATLGRTWAGYIGSKQHHFQAESPAHRPTAKNKERGDEEQKDLREREPIRHSHGVGTKS